MASNSKALVSPWDKADRSNNSKARSHSVYNKSWQRTAIGKLRKVRANRDCGENELALLAKGLSMHAKLSLHVTRESISFHTHSVHGYGISPAWLVVEEI